MASIPVLITENLPKHLLERARAVSSDIHLIVRPAKSVEQIPEDVLLQTRILCTFDILPDPEDVPNLDWIQFLTAGIERFVDHPLLHSEVKVTTLSGAAASQMAEAALMFSLALARRLPLMLEDKANKVWPEDRFTRLQPRNLRGSTVGIYGYGSVGREIARLFHAMGAKVLAIKRDLKQLRDPGYTRPGLGDPEGSLVERFYPPQALPSMASLSDFLIITVPLTESTRGTVDQRVFSGMKSSAFLIDISRGSVLDHGDLITALNERRLAGAALDVYPIEPLPESSPLWEMSNVILSPHIAGYSATYSEQAADLVVENLTRYTSDQTLLNLYNPAYGY